MSGRIRRELQVAFSRKTQPVWVRIVKWIVIVAAVIAWRDKPHFWLGILLVLVLAIGLHLFYRWKTHAWTRAWGGWDDVDADR